VKYLPLFHHFKAIYQFPKHIIFLVKIVANASLNNIVNYKTPNYNIIYTIKMLISRVNWSNMHFLPEGIFKF